MYPARLVGRVVGCHRHGPRGRRRRWPRSAAASSPIAWAGRPPSRWPAWSGSPARSRTPGLRAASAERPPVFSARESIRALRERPVLGQVALAQGFYGGGLIAAVPLYALVHVDRLDLQPGRRRGHRHPGGRRDDDHVPGLGRGGGSVRAARGRCGSGSTFGVSRCSATPWPRTSPSCGLAAVASGAASASIDVGIAAVVSDQTPLASRAAGDGRLERDHRRARHRRRVPHERAAAARASSTSRPGCCCARPSSAVGVLLFARANRRGGAPAASRARRSGADRCPLAPPAARPVEHPLVDLARAATMRPCD